MKCRCPECGYEFQTKGNTEKMFNMLKKKDMKISNLSKELNISRPAVYHHITKLRKQGLIKEYFKNTKGKPHFIGIKDSFVHKSSKKIKPNNRGKT